MKDHQRLRLIANALLALGALAMAAALASGLARQGFAGFALVAAAFIAMRLLAKPWLVSRGYLAGLTLEAAGQVALVLVLFWVGVGLSQASGWQPALPLWAPMLCILGAGLAARALWRPLPPEFDSFLDDVTAQLDTMAQDIARDAARSPAAQTPDTTANLLALHAALDALPETGAPHHAIASVVLSSQEGLPWYQWRNLLFDRARATGHDRDLRALIIALSDPWLARITLGEEDLDAAFDLIEANPQDDVLICLVLQSFALLDLHPPSWRDMPSPDRLRALIASLKNPVRAEIESLAARIAQVQTEAQST